MFKVGRERREGSSERKKEEEKVFESADAIAGFVCARRRCHVMNVQIRTVQQQQASMQASSS